MIHRAKFQNFKALRDVEVTFDSRLTVLVGPNGSGKTSVLQGMDILCRVAAPSDGSQPFGGFGRLQGYSPSVAVGIEDIGRLEQCASSGSTFEAMRLECRTLNSSGHEVIASIEVDEARPQDGLSGFLTFAPQPLHRGRVEFAPLDQRTLFGRSLFLRLDPLQLAAPSVVLTRPPYMDATGAGLPSTLAYIALNQPETFTRITQAFKAVVPVASRIRFDKAEANGGFGDTILFDFLGANGVQASHASNGTLCALGLLASILGPLQPRVVLLDDLDHGLHPKAQMELIEVLRTLLIQYPDLQIVATSHSPYILNQLEWNEVRVTALNDDGSAVCKPLTDHPDFERWREAMTPGEFWSTFYEDWLTKSRKPQAVS